MLKVMLSTGYEANQSVQRVLDLGMVGFINKPYEISRLSHAVDKAINKIKLEATA